MEIQIRRHSCDLSRQKPTSFSKLFDDIPTFEEAFDPASLRKFFQEYESTNSQSTYSPQKDRLILEDVHSQGTNEHDFLFSPSSNLLNDFQFNGESRSSKGNFSFNFNLGPKGLNVKPSSPGYLSQGLPFTISQFPKRSISKVLDVHADTIQETINSELSRIEINGFGKRSYEESEKSEESIFETKLMRKQIFKIIKEARPRETPLNIKRKHSAPINENLDPVLKRVKGLQNVRRASTDVLLSVKGSALKNNESAMGSVFKISNF